MRCVGCTGVTIENVSLFRLHGYFDRRRVVRCAGCRGVTIEDDVQVVRVLRERKGVVYRLYGCAVCGGVTTEHVLCDVLVVRVLRQRTFWVLCRLYGGCDRSRVWEACWTDITTEDML